MKPYLKLKIWDNIPDGSQNDLQVEINTCIATKLETYKAEAKDVFMLNVKSGYQLKMDDKFYFCPGVAVPRVKLKDLASSHKAKTVRELDAATAIFIGNKTYDALAEYDWDIFVETEFLKEFMEEAHKAEDLPDYYYEKITTALEFYTLDDIIVDYSTAKLLRNQSYHYNLENKSVLLKESSQRTLTIKENMVDFYMDILERPVYMENELYPYLNGPDATVIDENMYESIHDMFSSSDKDNVVLAMEIMANCDWDKSIMYLCFLLEDFANTIYNQRSRTHVNFKSLLSYMDRSPSYIHICKDDMIKLIKEKGLLTKDIAEGILKKYAHEIYIGNTQYFKVKSVSLSEDIDKLLNEEIVLETKLLDKDEYDN